MNPNAEEAAVSGETRAEKIGTHDGKFHCDEVFACWMLKQLDDFKEHEIIRSRDPAILNGCDVVVDVGGVFDHTNKRYDHHQKNFNETMTSLGVLSGFGTRLSSAGLVYAYYGKRVISKLTNSKPESELVTILFRRLYECYVEAVDAKDNTIAPFDEKLRYHIGGSISSRVASLNPNWIESGSVNADVRFQEAMQLVGNDFADTVDYLRRGWRPTQQQPLTTRPAPLARGKKIPTTANPDAEEAAVSGETRAEKIGTHDEKFHCDEVFACWMLKQLDDFKEHEIIRSRDPAILNGCDVVVDVGGVFDHTNKRYDHHQKNFNETMTSLGVLSGFGTRLSSAGLVYAYYGKRVISKIIRKLTNSEPESELVDTLFHRLYECYVEAVDAMDNVIAPFDREPRYYIGGSTFSRVDRLNFNWIGNESVNADDCFLQAMELAGGDFINDVNYLCQVWWPARQIVEGGVAKRFEVDESGKIVEFSVGLPWTEHFFNYEKEHNLMSANITYIIYKDQPNSWKVEAIPENREASSKRKLLPLSWRGLGGEKLSKKVEIEGAIFVHRAGYIGGAKTRDAALEMARKALTMN